MIKLILAILIALSSCPIGYSINGIVGPYVQLPKEDGFVIAWNSESKATPCDVIIDSKTYQINISTKMF